jgi:integrase
MSATIRHRIVGRPMRNLNRLSALRVSKKSKRGRYADGGGLYLQVSATGARSWLFRYERSGKERQMGLGPARDVSLSDARDEASACRKLLLKDVDPIESRRGERMRAKIKAARTATFEECAAVHRRSRGRLENAVHRRQWGSTLSTYAYPLIGKLPVDAVDTSLVTKILKPLWPEKPVTASRLRGRIECILDFATVSGHRSGENPARWRGHLDKLLPARSAVRPVKHHAALPYAELPEFMAELRQREGVSADALELVILTALRTGELIGGRWAELDPAGKVWTIPGERMKRGREHRVPLCKRALEILQGLPQDRELIFEGARAEEPLSNMALLEMVRGMGLTVHGFRSTFRDWAAERTNFPNHVVEMALAHAIGDKVEAAYRRGDLFEKRRRLMEDWARYCARPAMTGDNVLAIRGAKQ